MGERMVIPSPPPQVHVTSTTDVKVGPAQVTVNLAGFGALVAAVVAEAGKVISKETRVSTGTNSFDGQQNYRNPDQGTRLGPL
jgi:hypothetical protein